MALIKKDASPATATGGDSGTPGTQKRHALRGPGGLLAQLDDPSPQVRRWAIRDLSAFPEAVKALCQHLKTEPVEVVRESVFTSLATIGGSEVVECLVPLLRSEDAAMRNSAIEVLQQLPNEMESHMEALMTDEDVDVRGFSIDIMNGLGHPKIPLWLVQILQEETDINICSKAVETLSEVGMPEHVPVLRQLLTRFPETPYLQFTVDLTIRRIMAGGN